MSLIFLAKKTTSKASLLKLVCKYIIINYWSKHYKLIAGRKENLISIYWKSFLSHRDYIYRIMFAMSELLFFHGTQFVFLIVTRFGGRFDDGRRLRTGGYHLWCSLSTLNKKAIYIYEPRHDYNRYLYYSKKNYGMLYSYVVGQSFCVHLWFEVLQIF